MREKFEILAKVSGWNGSLSRDSSNEFSAEPESLSKLLDHVVIVLERREITCVELNRSLERQQLELEASREQVNLAANRLKEIRERFNSSESQLIGANSKISTLSAQILTLEQSLKREKSQATWATEELQKNLDAFAAFRKEKMVEIGQIRSQAEISISQAQETQKSLQRTIQNLKEREKQVAELQEQVSNLKSQLSTNEANFTREMNSSTRMMELYKNASEEATERIAILQNEIEDLRETLTTFEAQESGHSADLEAELEDREQIIKAKEEQLEKMRIALDGLLKVAKSQNDQNESTSVVDEFSTSEQIYTEYSLCRGKLARAEEECCQLRINMQEMINEINTRAPLLDSLKADNYRLQGDVSTLTEQLIQVAASRDSAIELKNEFERNLINLCKEKETLQQECNDLSQQVQRLLLEIETTGNGDSCSQVNNKRQRGTTGEVLRASEIITENLVDISSVSQLQQRNQELLRSLRGITAKYEALEKDKESPKLKEQLEIALKELDEMHEARKRQSQMVETILKTKTATGDNTNASPYKNTISEALTIELEQLKKQLESKQEVLKKTISELEIAKKELTEEKVSKARLTAQLELNEERFKMINETLKHERIEAVGLRERISSQMESLNQAQTSSYKLMADFSSSQERENRLHSQIEKLQTEINGFLMETSRLQQETLNASSERDRLTSLLSSMQGVLSEHEASESTLKRHFTTQVEFMERELEASRSRISEITSSHSAALSALERDRSELFRRLELISEELSQKKEINLRLESALNESKDKILDLERVLQQAAAESIHDESNVKTFELRIRALTTELKNQQNYLQISTARISELEGQLKEMENLKFELQTEKENLAIKESNLIEATTEIEHLKGDKERLEEELNGLKENFSLSRENVEKLTKEIDELKSEISSKTQKIEETEKEKEEFNLKLKEFKSRCLELENSVAFGECDRKHLKSTIENLEERLQSLKHQNDTLLDEAQKMASATTEMSDELVEGTAESGVIRFLREEKDKLQEEKEKLLSEVRQFQLQAEEAQRTLNSERLAVAAQSADYARLLAEVERLNSSRESGALQQHETSQMKMKLTVLESQLREKNSALAPLRESLETAQCEIEQLKESLSMLQTDRDSWKTRFEAAISTASDTTSPLETELKQVKLQSEMFRQRAILLTKNLQETRSAAQKEIAELQGEIELLQSKVTKETVTSAPMTSVPVTSAPVNSVLAPANTVPVTNAPVALEAAPVEVTPVSEDVEMTQAEPESVPVTAAAAASEEIESEHDESDDDDSIYEETSEAVSESVTESIAESINESPADTLAETVVTPVTPIAPFTTVPAVEPVMTVESSTAEVEQPVITPAPVPAPVISIAQTSTAPVDAPRKKIVSLAGIVGSSSASTLAASTASSSTPTMITTASGKKFIPVTFPDPPSNATSTASAATNSPGSPSGGKTKKIKKGLGKKKKNKSD